MGLPIQNVCSLCVCVSTLLAGPVDVAYVGWASPPLSVSFDLGHTPSIGLAEAS